MTYRGRIKNGVVVLEEDVSLPDGTEVDVIPREGDRTNDEETDGPTLNERLKEIIGAADGLPPDAALNHDHYLYGTPKK